jgi:hypothetical protein
MATDSKQAFTFHTRSLTFLNKNSHVSRATAVNGAAHLKRPNEPESTLID